MPIATPAERSEVPVQIAAHPQPPATSTTVQPPAEPASSTVDSSSTASHSTTDTYRPAPAVTRAGRRVKFPKHLEHYMTLALAGE